MVKNKETKEKIEKEKAKSKMNNIDKKRKKNISVLNILKKIVLVIAFISVLFVLFLQFRFYSKLTNSVMENVVYSSMTLKQYVIVLASLAVICLLCNLSNIMFSGTKSKNNKEITKNKSKYFKLAFIVMLILIVTLQILFISKNGIIRQFDQKDLYDLASIKYERGEMEYFGKKYLARNPHQLGIFSAYYMLFKLLRSSSPAIYIAVNIISNLITIFMITKIGSLISKKYNGNEISAPVLIMLFVPLHLLVTLFYGDIPALALSSISTYMILLYANNNMILEKVENKIKEKNNTKQNNIRKINIYILKHEYIFLLVAGILMMLACILRKNSIIIFIAQVMYIVLVMTDKFRKSKNTQEIRFGEKRKKYIAKNLSSLFVMLILVILIPKIYNNYLYNRFKLKEIREPYGTAGYIYLGMAGIQKTNGWYDDYVTQEGNIRDYDTTDYYKEKIKERLKLYKENKDIALDFYYYKLASTWTESTYTSLWNNLDVLYVNDETKAKISELEKYEEALSLTQKALFIYILYNFLTCIIACLKSDEVPNDLMLFVLIFLGGMYFHIIWETKSRYIIPYIILTIPITSFYNVRIIREVEKNKK